ncbi:MAG: hypothetical protein M0T74_03885 [Desulfitobacterium hafniense]|nr:hypothetical protein [Desulfitobacterium hafniense]
MKEVAGYLPPSIEGKFESKTLTFQKNESTLEVDLPILTNEQISSLTEKVKRNSKTILKSFIVNDILDILDKAIERMLDRSSAYRQKAEKLLPIVTGMMKK